MAVNAFEVARRWRLARPIVASEVTPATANASCGPLPGRRATREEPAHRCEAHEREEVEPDHPPLQVVWGAELDERPYAGGEERRE